MFDKKKVVSRPRFYTAVQVTEENLSDVADWCAGDVRTTATRVTSSVETRYIKVKVYLPLNERQTKAFVGDWILFADNRYKVYTQNAFDKGFAPVEEQA